MRADKVRALEGVIAEHYAIKREISILGELVQKMTTTKSSGNSENWQNREKEGEEFGG
jgi:hypothetical protein